jgi:hypothetical protein
VRSTRLDHPHHDHDHDNRQPLLSLLLCPQHRVRSSFIAAYCIPNTSKGPAPNKFTSTYHRVTTCACWCGIGNQSWADTNNPITCKLLQKVQEIQVQIQIQTTDSLNDHYMSKSSTLHILVARISCNVSQRRR